ncbi:ArnT family glycosyltransferase [Rhodanobacter sp. FW106-PBR-LB-2-11]|uniref:ArnT family glycosyltransferase n=1 Tax=Rhodanobacter sp. FW106-PBR-LB-2-11 TaxID=1524463 RepID=UPI0034E61822
MTSGFVAFARSAASGRTSWLVGLLLLLPPVFFLHPLPVDETRYLAAAWNMHVTGQWLVPHLDGLAYSEKAPLLFWLINLAWSLTGVHAWTARLLELLIALGTLPLLASLGRQLGVDRAGIQAAAWLWLGCAAVALYADAVMFDMLLTLCTLLAWRSTLALRGRHPLASMLLLAAALGAGILVKGPVALLVGGMPALLAPLWMPEARTRTSVFYLQLLAALALAVAIALAWAIPAARAGGPAYADAIFLRQTMGRVVHSFAHARPWWWYLPILPVMLLPWSLAITRGAKAVAATEHGAAVVRFAAVASLPSFIIFSLISGKQPHYLLPILPPLVLLAGHRLGTGQWRVAGWRLGLVLAAAGVATAIGMGWLAPATRVETGLVGALIVALGLLYVWRREAALPASLAAMGVLASLTLCKLAFAISLAPRYDMRPVAARIASAQQAGIPLLYAGTQYGLFTFAGRLTQSIPQATGDAAIATWARAHPTGWIISGDANYQYPATPLYRQDYLGRKLGIWLAADVTRSAPATLAPHGQSEK